MPLTLESFSLLSRKSQTTFGTGGTRPSTRLRKLRELNLDCVCTCPLKIHGCIFAVDALPLVSGIFIVVQDHAMQTAAAQGWALGIENSAAFSFDEPHADGLRLDIRKFLHNFPGVIQKLKSWFAVGSYRQQNAHFALLIANLQTYGAIWRSSHHRSLYVMAVCRKEFAPSSILLVWRQLLNLIICFSFFFDWEITLILNGDTGKLVLSFLSSIDGKDLVQTR
jgi:hypothetical protein